MENNKGKVKLNDDLLDKVSGGGDEDDEKFRPDYTGPGVYWIFHEHCGNMCLYETPFPEICNACSMPLYCVDLSQD